MIAEGKGSGDDWKIAKDEEEIVRYRGRISDNDRGETVRSRIIGEVIKTKKEWERGT